MKNKKSTPLMTVIFLVYLWILFRLTVFRSGFTFDGISLFSNGSIVLMPASTYMMLYNHKAYWLMAYNFFGNIIMFIPFGVYIRYIKPKIKLTNLIFLGMLFSFAIEFLQYMLGTGVSDIDDIILNTFGVLIGGIIQKGRKKR